MSRPERFEIAFPDAALDDLRARLERTRWPDGPDPDSWDGGTSETYLRRLAADWAHAFAWREHEAALNAYEHLRVDVGGQTLHWLHVRRSGTVPLVLLHGWPSTFWDFAGLFPLLDGHELIVPSLPGFGFSPLARGSIGYLETAELVHELVTGVLGHHRYAVFGFDWGALVAEQLAHVHPEAVAGLHTSMPFPLDFAPIDPALWAPEEAPFAELTARWWQEGSAYFQIQATRPDTVAYVGDSPAAVAGWIVEKLHAWTDHDGDFESAYPRERVLATLSLYWLTGTFGSAARFYASSLRRPWTAAREGIPVVSVPTGIAAFPKENTQVPRVWAEGYFDLRRYTRLPKGGHFAAVEQPEALAAELDAFLDELPR